MAEDVDLWGVLDEAEQTVQGWEAWRQEIEVDLWGATNDAAAPRETPLTER